jgi:hypothetical protein
MDGTVWACAARFVVKAFELLRRDYEACRNVVVFLRATSIILDHDRETRR